MGHGESCEFVFVCASFVHQKCSNYALNNLLFGLCRFVWVIDLLVILPTFYLKVPTHPFTLKILPAKERTPTFHSFAMFTLDSHLSLLRSLGVCQLISNVVKKNFFTSFTLGWTSIAFLILVIIKLLLIFYRSQIVIFLKMMKLLQQTFTLMWRA
jgi:hypothetical protein